MVEQCASVIGQLAEKVTYGPSLTAKKNSTSLVHTNLLY